MPKTPSPFNNYCLEIIQFLKKIFEYLQSRNPNLSIDLSIFDMDKNSGHNAPGKINIKQSAKQAPQNMTHGGGRNSPAISSKIENPFTLQNILRQSLRETDSKFREEMIKRLDSQKPSGVIYK